MCARSASCQYNGAGRQNTRISNAAGEEEGRRRGSGEEKKKLNETNKYEMNMDMLSLGGHHKLSRYDGTTQNTCHQCLVLFCLSSLWLRTHYTLATRASHFGILGLFCLTSASRPPARIVDSCAVLRFNFFCISFQVEMTFSGYPSSHRLVHCFGRFRHTVEYVNRVGVILPIFRF